MLYVEINYPTIFMSDYSATVSEEEFSAKLSSSIPVSCRAVKTTSDISSVTDANDITINCEDFTKILDVRDPLKPFHLTVNGVKHLNVIKKTWTKQHSEPASKAEQKANDYFATPE